MRLDLFETVSRSLYQESNAHPTVWQQSGNIGNYASNAINSSESADFVLITFSIYIIDSLIRG